jgi:methionyl aminopeptidase
MAKRKRRRGGAGVLTPPSSPPVAPGLVGPTRSVARTIPRPPYAATGDPGAETMSVIRSAPEIEAMRHAGCAAAEILLEAAPMAVPGITSDAIDEVVHEATVARGGYPSPLNYRGFPKSVCTSVNEVICHGIPDSRALRDGDIVNIDVTIYIDGVHGDTSATFLVGDVDESSQRLVAATRESLLNAIATVGPGSQLKAIGKAIEDVSNASNLTVVREFIGHGIGTEFHSALQVPHYYEPRLNTTLEPGTTFTIEPMLSLGGPGMYVWSDGWTAVTADGARSAQFEHTLLVTDDGVEILTVNAAGEWAGGAVNPTA